jgi:hypothetical protein
MGRIEHETWQERDPKQEWGVSGYSPHAQGGARQIQGIISPFWVLQHERISDNLPRKKSAAHTSLPVFYEDIHFRPG